MNAFIECTNKILQLHELMADGRGDDEDADVLRDEIVDLQRDLDWLDEDISNALSGDLYMLQEEDLYVKTNEIERQALLIRLLWAVSEQSRENALVILKLLRYNMGISRTRIAEYRYYVWRCLNPVVGNAFRSYWEKLLAEGINTEDEPSQLGDSDVSA